MQRSKGGSCVGRGRGVVLDLPPREDHGDLSLKQTNTSTPDINVCGIISCLETFYVQCTEINSCACSVVTCIL